MAINGARTPFSPIRSFDEDFTLETFLAVAKSP